MAGDDDDDDDDDAVCATLSPLTSSSHTLSKYLSMVSTREWMNSMLIS